MSYVLFNDDCLKALKELPDDSVDSLVTDPPAGISFMGKAWDDDKGGRKQWIGWMSEVMVEVKRVLKPGAHGFVWAIPRTSHWTATALEDAGFEIRDVVTHLFGSGFPKSHNIEKATNDPKFKGFGTALKPASEHWILIRKPCDEKTVAKNVLKHGTGGINIDASRIGTELIPQKGKLGNSNSLSYKENGSANYINTPWTYSQGRFPANLVLSHNEDCDEQCTEGCAVTMLDAQSGTLTSGKPGIRRKAHETTSMSGRLDLTGNFESGFGDSGGAARFFYCAKASKKDKGSENTHPTVKSSTLMSYLIKLITPPNGIVLDPFMGSGSTGVAALKEGFTFFGIEKELEYYQIAEKRLENIK